MWSWALVVDGSSSGGCGCPGCAFCPQLHLPLHNHQPTSSMGCQAQSKLWGLVGWQVAAP